MRVKAPVVKSGRLKESGNDLVYSYQTLRNFIGFSGMLMPLVLALGTSFKAGHLFIEPSISDCYYTSNGDILVVVLSILGVFLFTYKGYNWKENVVTSIAAFCSLGVAFSPTATKFDQALFSVHTLNEKVPLIWGMERHLWFAGIFFITISFVSLVFFTKSDKDLSRINNQKLSPKQKRNIVFKVCGWIMLGCIAVMALFIKVPAVHDVFDGVPFVFICETIAIEAFGISWLTKGETFFPDGKHYLSKII